MSQQHRAPSRLDSAQPVELASLEQLPAKGRIRHTGYIQSVTYMPPGDPPRLVATVVDQFTAPGPRRMAVAHVRLLFMGQKSVPGIKPGARISYSGMVSLVDKIPTVHNPRYVILPQRSD